MAANETSTDRLAAFIKTLRARGVGSHQPAFDEQAFRKHCADTNQALAAEGAEERRGAQIVREAQAQTRPIACGAQRDPAKVAA